MSPRTETRNGTAASALPEKRYDGIVCFGGVDWWYHNRGHYDLQMMRELSRSMPVLYVNSISMRVPRLAEGRMFFRRAARKLASLRRGLVEVRPGFAVYSPPSIPGRLGRRLSRFALPRRVRRAARRLGIERPLVWVACPPAELFLADLDPAGVVYQRTDRFEAFEGVDPEFIRGCGERLARRADLTLFCSRSLFDEEKKRCRRAAFVDHGVDFERFRRAGERGSEPADVAHLPRPRVGFVGGIDRHTFDPELFVEVAARLPEASFLLVGACSLAEGWCELPNVHLFGQRPYEEVAAYMAACEVLIMPWNQSEWIRACNPVKLKEYLAVGRPVVSRPFDELAHYRGLVRCADDVDAFASEIRRALTHPHDPGAQRARVREETWESKAEKVLARLEDAGVAPEPRR